MLTGYGSIKIQHELDPAKSFLNQRLYLAVISSKGCAFIIVATHRKTAVGRVKPIYKCLPTQSCALFKAGKGSTSFFL